MATSATEPHRITPAEVDEKAREGAAAGKAAAGAVVDAGSAVANGVRSGFKSFSEWWDHATKGFKEKGFWGGLQEMFSGIGDGIGSLFGGSGLNVGSMGGGLLGILAGWMAGSMVGGGWLGMLFGGGLAIFGGFLGAQIGDKTINPMLGRPGRGTKPATGTPVQHVAMQQDQQQGQVAAQTEPRVDFTKLTDVTPIPVMTTEPETSLYDGQFYNQFVADQRMQATPTSALPVVESTVLGVVTYSRVPPGQYMPPTLQPNGALPPAPGYSLISGGLPRTR